MAKTQVPGSQILDNDITFDDIADGAVRGATSNAGTQRELATGTVSTPDLRDGSVSPAKLLNTGDFTVNSILYADGSATAPTISFTADTNTGMYRIATDILGFATTGAERIRINELGEVGIGGSPITNGILTLVSTTKAFIPPKMSTTQRDAITSPSAGMIVYNTTTNALNIYTASWGTPAVTETDPFSIHLDGSNSPSANIDWNKKQILQLVVELRTSTPSSPTEGQIWYRTDLHQWLGYNGTSNVILG